MQEKFDNKNCGNIKDFEKILLKFIILMNFVVKTFVEFQKIYSIYKSNNSEDFIESYQ